MINYYVVLEIPNFSDQAAIKKAYRTLSKKYHPDVNKDPFANSYFLKINEAYDFLIDENKRLLLHQFLHFQNASQNNQSKYQEKTSVENSNLQPVIHFFSADKKHFVLNDHILLQWNISQCKAVHINVFGNVAFAGTHYLKIEHFAEEIIVLMTVIGLNNKEYKYQIKLKYSNKNPAQKAYQKIKTQYPNAQEIHFKKETFFGLNARINKNQFKNRMILLGSIFVLVLLLFIFVPFKTVSFLMLLILCWKIFVQSYKRIHDTVKYKEKDWLLLMPFYNLLVISELFYLESQPSINQYGIIPQSTPVSFKNWLLNGFKNINSQLSLLQKFSLGSFLLLSILVTFKGIIPQKEIAAELTSHYAKSSRPTSRGNITVNYFLVFNDRISVNVSEDYYHEVVNKKTYNTFKIALKNSHEAEYVRLINSKSNQNKRLNLGLLQSNNPALIIAFLLFLSQIYVLKNLTAPTELKFANGYMVFTMIVYLYVILQAIF